MEKLLLPKEVADILSVSVSFVYQLMQKGELPCVHVGTAVRVRPVDLAEFIKNSRSVKDEREG